MHFKKSLQWCVLQRILDVTHICLPLKLYRKPKRWLRKQKLKKRQQRRKATKKAWKAAEKAAERETCSNMRQKNTCLASKKNKTFFQSTLVSNTAVTSSVAAYVTTKISEVIDRNQCC